MEKENENENITFILGEMNDTEYQEETLDDNVLNNLWLELEKLYLEEKQTNCNIDDKENINLQISNKVNYNINFTIKQLLIITDYYGLNKIIKSYKKCKKEDIIHILVEFESMKENSLIVNKRKQLWHYMNELKNDNFMKKYVLWT
jgi:hypothetical protein